MGYSAESLLIWEPAACFMVQCGHGRSEQNVGQLPPHWWRYETELQLICLGKCTDFRSELGVQGPLSSSPRTEPPTGFPFLHYWVRRVSAVWRIKIAPLKERWFPTTFVISTVPKEGWVFMAQISYLKHLLLNPLIKPRHPTVWFLKIISHLLSGT